MISLQNRVNKIESQTRGYRNKIDVPKGKGKEKRKINIKDRIKN